MYVLVDFQNYISKRSAVSLDQRRPGVSSWPSEAKNACLDFSGPGRRFLFISACAPTSQLNHCRCCHGQCGWSMTQAMRPCG